MAFAEGTEPAVAGEPAVAATAPPGSPLRRQVHRSALVVGVPLTLILFVLCLVPHDYYTGTNSVRTRDFVQPVKAHQTLCVRGLNLPANTGRVQFELVTSGAQPPLLLRLRTAEGTIVSRLASRRAAPSTRAKVAFPIARRPSTPDAVPATACVTPDARVTFGGTLNIGGAAPTVDGKPQISSIAVWFLPPQGAERSFISQLPSIVERAALFRPGVVGPWTYVVLLALLLPAAGILGVRLLARADEARTWRIAGGVFLAAFMVSASWALITPPFQGPDEQDHFAYVQHLAETGHAPHQQAKPGDQPWAQDERNALTYTRALAANEQSDGRPPWLAANERAWERQVRRDGRNRADGGGPTTSAAHGPVYYAALVPAYAATRSSSIWSQLTLERLMSALIGSLAALFTFLAVREILPRPLFFAAAAGLLVAFQPMFTFIAATVNNDVGINAAAAGTIFLIMRMLRRGASPGLLCGLGALLGLLPIIKGTGYELYPIAAVAAVGALIRFRDRRAVVGVCLLVVSGLAIQVVWSQIAPSFGHTTFTTPGGGAPTSSSALSTPGLFISYLWQIFFPRLPGMTDHFTQTWPFFNIYVERAWASFGWYTIQFPRYVYGLIMLAMAGAVVLGVVAIRREWPWVRTRLWELLVLVLLPLAVIAGVESAFATAQPRPILAEMGRYLFPAISALSILAVGATVGVGRRRAVSVVTGVVVAEFVLVYASQLLELRGFYT